MRIRSRASSLCFALSTIPFVLVSAGMDCQGPPGVPGAVSLANDVQPIFNAHCIACHADGGAAVLAGIPLRLTPGDAHGSLVNQPSVQDASLTLVVPGNAAASLLFTKVSQDTPPVGARMPLFGNNLSADQIALIQAWIDQGAMDN